MLNFLAHYNMNFPNVQATFDALPKFTYTVVNRECMFCIKLPTAFAVPTGPLVIKKGRGGGGGGKSDIHNC
jgi:hypothetical protein